MRYLPVEIELHELWRAEVAAGRGADSVYLRAMNAIQVLRSNAHWATGTPADLPLASPRPWSLYCSGEGLRITSGHSTEDGHPDRYHHVITGPRADKGNDRERGRLWVQNAELIVRAVNNWR